MNNVILAIIAIAIVVVLAASGAYYGGDAYQNGKINGEVARYINESEQVAAAVTLYESDGNEVGTTFTLDTLVEENYLSQLPQGWEPHMNTLAVSIVGSEEMSASVCFEANKAKGFIFDSIEPNSIPYIKDSNYSIPICINELDRAIPCCHVPD